MTRAGYGNVIWVKTFAPCGLRREIWSVSYPALLQKRVFTQPPPFLGRETVINFSCAKLPV